MGEDMMRECRKCHELKSDYDFKWSPEDDTCGDCYLKEGK